VKFLGEIKKMKQKTARLIICMFFLMTLVLPSGISTMRITEDRDDTECPCTLDSETVVASGHQPSREDPLFEYETIIDGYWLSQGLGITVDANNNAYVIASWYQDQQHLDILIIKLDAEGEPVWMVPIIGDELEHDYPTDITLDPENNVWVTGFTSSETFPTTPDALYPNHIHFRDAFVMKLDSEDGTILYSTYLGGDYTDEAHGIYVNDVGDVYVVGSTGSTDFPTTPDAYQDEPSAPAYLYTDVFITKISAAGDELLYSTYFGGYQDDRAENVALDDAGNIVFAGETTADDFPLVNPISSDPNDLFLSQLSADGSTLQFSTYFGGEDPDSLGGMVLDAEGFVYIAGSTQSIYFPTTPGVFQEDFMGEILGCGNPPFVPLYNCPDVFITKVEIEGSGLIYSTYLGGSHTEECRDIAVDSQGCAYAVGYTASADFPPDGIDTAAEIFVSKVNAAGSELEYSVTIDSSSPNAGHGIALDDADMVYFTGALNAPSDIYIAKLNMGEAEVQPDAYSILRGRYIAGELEDLFTSNNSYLVIQAGLTLFLTEPPVWVEVTGNAPTANPSVLTFTVEAHVDTENLMQKIELYNYVTQEYEEVDYRPASTSDEVVEVIISNNPARFIDPNTLRMNAHLSWKPSGLIPFSSWQAQIDQSIWTITP
jgi:hypothetical protein